MNIQNKDLIDLLLENEIHKKALSDIYNAITDRREDEHGNAEPAQERLDRVLHETQVALGNAGYHVYKMTGKEKPRAHIPEFLQERETR